MNYQGRVTSVNATTMTFEIDNNIIVHMGHLSASTNKSYLPELGELVKIFNSHFKITLMNKLEKLFVCDRSKILCKHFTEIADNSFVKLIEEYSLGCSDLHIIDVNLPVIEDRIKDLAENSASEIMFEIVQELCDVTKNENYHKCVNKIISPLTLKTVSDYRFVDLHSNNDEKMPVWCFGSHSQGRTDKLVGFLQVNKRYGMLLLHDKDCTIPCVVVNSTNENLLDVINQFVLIKTFRMFTEVYREKGVPRMQYVLFDVKDIQILQNICHKSVANVKQLIMNKLPQSFPFVYKFKFKILRKAMVSINKYSQIECWLDVLLLEKSQQIYLGLNPYQVQISPFFLEGQVYEVYHSNKLADSTNVELTRIKLQSVLKFQEKTAIFVYISQESPNRALNVAEVFEKKDERKEELISVQGLVTMKKFTPTLSSRTKKFSTSNEFGTPGSCTHSLAFEDDGGNFTIFFYLNNWENLLIPLGLIPGMRIRVKNVLFNEKYFKSTALTSFEVIGYEPPVFFDSANSFKNVERDCDKYSYLGWGDLIPSNVLVWSRVSVLFLRSLKIKFVCRGCNTNCTCTIDTTLTFYVHDEFGAALVLSKSLELLRLILGLTSEQWKIWYTAFKEIKEYVYSDSDLIQSEDPYVRSFCETLTKYIRINNTCKISKLDLKCRKLDSSPNDDNDNMPLWFCTDVRINENGLF